jgi:alpha-beta hydrolase superfamily lysophospholipase
MTTTSLQPLRSGDGTTLHARTWLPAGAARGAVALVHGYGEHIGRYEHVGQAWAARGWAVYGADLRGHGQSAGARGYCDRFAQYLDDLAALVAAARATSGPLFLVGHSFGGVIATRYLLRDASGIAGLMLSSPYFRLKLAVSPIKVAAAKFFSALVPRLSLPLGLKGTDVLREPEWLALYDSDPLNNKNATARWFTESQSAQAECLARAGEVKLPVLLKHGAADRIADPKASEELFGRLGSADKTLELLAGQFHEIFNDLAAERQKTIASVADWLDAHAATPDKRAATPKDASGRVDEKVAQ